MNLYLELTNLSTELADFSFVYELYNKVSNGNFSGKVEGSTITLLSNEVLNTSKDLYTLYIYIDGNLNNPIEIAEKNFLFKLWGRSNIQRECNNHLVIVHQNSLILK